MSKKIITLIIVVILLVIIAGVVYFMNQNSNENNGNQEELSNQTELNNQAENNTALSEENNSENTEAGRTLVVYFSAQGHTEEVAQKIANNLGADIFEIVPVDEYTSADLDWTA